MGGEEERIVMERGYRVRRGRWRTGVRSDGGTEWVEGGDGGR